VRSPSNTVQLDLNTIIQPILETLFASPGTFKASLIYYSDNILAVHVETASRPNIGHIIAINTMEKPPHSNRVLRVVQTASNSKLFVRHTSRYLYHGTHTGIGDDGHHKWEISGVSLDDKFPLPETDEPLLLDDFLGTDIGSTVAFEIYNDYFYAVSTQEEYPDDKIDGMSYYHCLRFPLDDPELEDKGFVYRRQHAQGPINNSWTILSLQLSERTKEVMILESRREWAQASSRQSRTFYTSKFEVKKNHSSRSPSPSGDVSDAKPPPEDGLFVDLDSSKKPHWPPTSVQYSWSRHPEFTKYNVSPRSFTLLRTKFRAYSHSCNTFLDVVEDEQCCNDPTKPPCLRLRVGSRREAFTNPKGKDFEDHVQYRNSSIRMWPPPASKCPCSKRLHHILNPQLPSDSSHARTVTGVLDDRTLVIMIKPGRLNGARDDSTLGTIVVIDFTRPWILGDSTPSWPTQIKRVDSMMDDDNSSIEHNKKWANDFHKKHWQWTTGQQRRCESQKCR
jgi:hypothetical protein